MNCKINLSTEKDNIFFSVLCREKGNRSCDSSLLPFSSNSQICDSNGPASWFALKHSLQTYRDNPAINSYVIIAFCFFIPPLSVNISITLNCRSAINTRPIGCQVHRRHSLLLCNHDVVATAHWCVYTGCWLMLHRACHVPPKHL